MRFHPFLTAVALAAFVQPAAFAQEVLTFGEAIAIAQDNSLAVRASQSKLAQSETQIQQTYAGLYPQLSLTSSALSYRQIDSSGGLGAGGLGGLGGLGGFGGLGGLGGLGGFGGAGGTYNLVQTSLSLTQILFDGFQTADALKIADASVQLNRVDIANQRRKAGYDAANAYLQVLRAEGLREVALRAVQQAQSHVESAQIRERAGTGTRFDVLQAESQLANVQGQLRSTTNGVELARLSLANVLGMPVSNRQLSSAVNLPSIGYGLEDDPAPAIANRAELQSLQLKRRIDEATIDLNRKANYPKAQAQLQYQQQGLGTSRTLMALAGVQWNLIDWGKADVKVRASEQDLRQTDLNIELARRQLAIDVQSALLSRQDAKDRLTIAQRGLQLSQESYRMAQVRYNAGVGTGYEVIDAQTMLVQAQNTYVQANNDLQAAEVRVAQALGVDLGTAIAASGL